MIAKCRSKVKEDETRNVNNWKKHFDKLKETHSEEQDSNEIDNLLKYAEKPSTNENRQIHRNYQKTTITTTTDQATAIHEDIKFIKCTTHPRWNRCLKTRTIFYPNTKIKHSWTWEWYFSIYKKITIDLPLPKQQHCWWIYC